MSKNNPWLFTLLITGLLAPPTAFTANAPSDTGSKEALKESAIRGTDKFTGKEFMVFESVGNEHYEQKGQFSKMTFYVAPLFRLIPEPKTQQVFQETRYPDLKIVQYTFFVECFHPRIDEQVLKKIKKYYSKSESNHVFTEEQIHHMRHGQVKIQASNLPPSVIVEPLVIGTDTPSSTIMLDAVEEFTVNVPLKVDKYFRTRLDNGIKFQFIVYFNVMNLSRLQLAWSIEDIRQTSTYKQLNSGGAHYVSAEQVHNLTREVAETRNVYYYQDPEIDDKIVDKAFELFDKIRGDMQALTVQNSQQAVELEAKLVQGTGLSADEFKPLTLRWEVYEKLETIDDHKTANEVIKETYHRSKQAYQQLDDAYQRHENSASRSSHHDSREQAKRNKLDMKAGFDYEINLSGTKGQGDMYYNHDYQNTKSSQNKRTDAAQSKADENTRQKTTRSETAEDKINQGYFKNTDELRTYQAQTTEQKRPQVKIIGRGLNVIEKSQFEQNLKMMASSVFVQPMVEAKSFMTDAKISIHSKNKVPTSQAETYPEIEKLREQANQKTTEIDELRQSVTQKEKQIKALKTQLNPNDAASKCNIFQDRLKDGHFGPEMVWIPAGTFRMGAIQGSNYKHEQPVHRVSVEKFAMGRYEITFAEYDKFAKATGREKPDDKGWGRGNRPVINVSWYDVKAYADWLSEQTGQNYRLPTEAEWEYAARGSSTTKYWWGNHIGANNANCNKECGDKFQYTAPVGSFAANPFGLHDTVGNVWEWTCSELQNPYQGKEKHCADNGSSFVVRGGAWGYGAVVVRAAYRGSSGQANRNEYYGARLVRQ